MKQKTTEVGLALVAAIAMASAAVPAAADEATGLEKCYGISKAGENSCANKPATHSCAGQSTVDYDGHEWRAVAAGVCEKIGGKLEAFEGVNPAKQT